MRSLREYWHRLRRPDRLTYRGLTVPIDRDFVPKAVVKQLLRDDYETPEIDAALALVRPDDRVLEIGSGLGVVSGLVARRLSSGRVLTFDANPHLQPRLAALHRLNAISNVETRHGILMRAPSAPTVTFHLNRHFPEGSVAGGAGTVEAIEVPVHDWDGVRADFAPNVLICDIEGAEADLLVGAELGGIRALVIELHPEVVPAPRLAALETFLGKAGFTPRPDLAAGTVVAWERAAS
ncbi:FkbM family methyltransferase [Oceaniglobus roseus]|uniref:FkbM family methyltransferase n=1 Tax=Oceaniglobus roseus TaxID=1737570 RepID=UPI000C7EF5DE|nr:FkbM family methyltransferase [Kandeliimicrobium roseum]